MGPAGPPRLHHTQAAPAIEPTRLERGFRVQLPGRPWRLGGRIDVQEAGRIRDTKTESTRRNDPHDMRQLTMYGLAIRILDHEAPAEYIVDGLRLTPAGTENYEARRSTRGAADFQALIRLVDLVDAAAQRGGFLPAAEGAWWCSLKWCGWWDVCPFGARGRMGRPALATVVAAAKAEGEP